MGISITSLIVSQKYVLVNTQIRRKFEWWGVQYGCLLREYGFLLFIWQFVGLYGYLLD